MALTAGDQLGPYEILGLIGAGGMGEVYRARDPRLGRNVAIKISAERFSERFDREARAVAALNHPNICTLYDVGPDYLVMEYVQGRPVGHCDDPRKLLEIATQIADGMQSAHAAGIVHRDLKPANVLVTGEGRVKILDFGLAKTMARPAATDTTFTLGVTQPGTVVGTVAYMSPEQARGLSEVDERSDQFSFGLVLYELATGHRAFERSSPAELMTAIIREEPGPLPAAIPAPLRWTIERCLSKDPEQRYHSTRDLYLELRHMPARLSGTATAAAPIATWASGRRLPAAMWLAPSCLVVGFLAAALWPIASVGSGRATPFATEAEIQTMPAWSPKGDRIAYTASVDGTLQIFTKQVGGSTRTQLTRQDASCSDPFWSADGTRVYYIVNRSDDRSLWSISVAGGQAEKVLDGISRAALSPDGRTMAVMARESGGLYRLAFSSPPGSTWQGYAQEPISKMRSIPGGNSSLQFSRDGKYLGFYTDAAGRVQFWKIPMDGGPPEEAHLGKIPQTTPTRFAWLPDARGIVSGTEGARASAPLWIWDFLAGTQQALTAGAGNEGFPAFSADGRMLAYSGGARGYDVLEVPLDGSAPRDLIATSRMEVAPSVAPDGIHFAYITDRSGADEIWLRNRQDGSERLVVGRGKSSGDEIHLLDCAISPDGSRVAYRRTQAGSVQIWIAPLSGESPVPLWEDSERVFQRGAAWSPDGNWIAFYSTRDGKNAVLKARVGASMRPDLVAYTESPQPVRWSPRGDWIAFQDSIGLRVVSPDGKLNRVLNARQWLTYGWSNDGTALYGIASLETQRMSLARIDVATGKETRLTDLGPRQAAMDFGLLSGSFEYRGFSVQPDGKSFLTSVYRAKLDLWLLEDFDRKTRLLDRLWRREAD